MRSGRILVRVEPADVGMFRFLLEAYDNLALFTVLEPDTALLKIIFARESENQVKSALCDIKRTLNIECTTWPLDHLSCTT